jgi:hypothetical protein
MTNSEDTRSRRQKILAVIDPASGASEGERANARALLARLDGSGARAESPRVLRREDVAAQPSRSGPKATVTVRIHGMDITYDLEDYEIIWPHVESPYDGTRQE